MAIKPITPNDYAPLPCGECPTVYFGTASVSGPLFLVGTFTSFRAEPAFKRIRGVPVLCGAKLRLWDTFCIPEEQGGNGLDHIFQLPCADHGATLWYVISDHCRSDLASGFTHVIRYTYEECGAAPSFVALECTFNVGVAAIDTALLFPTVYAGNPTLQIGTQFIAVGGNSVLRAYGTGAIRRSGIPGTTTYKISLYLGTEDRYLDSVTFSLGPSEVGYWLLNAVTFTDTGGALSTRCEVLSGFNAYTQRGGDHPNKMVAFIN